MFTLTHEEERVGSTRLERGDPSALTVSGEFINMGGAKALAGWIQSVGGQEDDGVVFMALDDSFALITPSGETLKFAEGHLMAVPEEDEAFLDISGLTIQDYQAYFAEHISALRRSV
jgi:hypothetical protein